MLTDFLALAGLAFSAFTSATILPGTSDAMFAALIWQKPQLALLAFWVAGISNSAGALLSYVLGQALYQKKRLKVSDNVLHYLKKYGAWLLLLSWLPIIGDALPVAAGWLRLNFWHCALAIIIGKFSRYFFIWQGVALISA